MQTQRKMLFNGLSLLTIGSILLSACSSASPAASTSTPSTPGTPAPAASTKPLEPLTIKGLANLYSQAPAKDSEFWKKMESEFNVSYSVDWVPADNYQQKLDLVLASGDIPELMQITNTTAPSVLKAAKAGAFWDLTPYLGDFSKYPNFKKYTNQNAWVLSKINGKNYFVPRTRGNLDSAVFIRQDWLDKLNLKLPTTTEEFANVMKVIAKSDPDGNGKNDTIGTLTTPGYFAAAFGTREPVRDSNGGIIHANLTSNYADYVSYMRELYQAGAIPKEFALINGTQQEEMFMTGRSATFVKNAWHKFRMEQENRKTQPDAKVTIIPYLKGPKGYAHIYDLGYFGGMAISKKVDEKKMLRILDFLNATVDEKYYNFVNFGMEGVHYTLKDGFPSLTDQGKKEVNASFNAPFIFSTAEFAKVDSPLAPMDYNLKVREEMKALYKIDAKIELFNVIQSDAWSTAWSKVKDEFVSMEAKAISGAISMDEFKAYQKKLADNPDFMKAWPEFTKSYEEFFGKK
ncbi:extracellular solute-binding protein [Paenibacillus agricola]|uniref:Extracellular solute-binding protein n=1 Tax=Paenibacillus agricola TaxID=2716264 RepID=A0ABX0J8X5_9BACL|nr:extracellular solute-binding protein [Paenibacillus agricola]NHN32887.1 extracellular solute-binding protein [Paenibacillus agricola]